MQLNYESHSCWLIARTEIKDEKVHLYFTVLKPEEGLSAANEAAADKAFKEKRTALIKLFYERGFDNVTPDDARKDDLVMTSSHSLMRAPIVQESTLLQLLRNEQFKKAPTRTRDVSTAAQGAER